MRRTRPIVVLLMGVYLTVTAACGQSGPLTLPSAADAGQSTDADDESEEDDER
jgi:predicted small lipoprotein YifL